jgi:hypothetical protein
MGYGLTINGQAEHVTRLKPACSYPDSVDRAPAGSFRVLIHRRPRANNQRSH